MQKISPQGKKKKTIGKSKRYGNFPDPTWRAIQSLKERIKFRDVGKYGKNHKLASTVYEIFHLILDNIILKKTNLKRNKRFLQMVLNNVSRKLNEVIQAEKNNSDEHQFYFKLLAKYRNKVMNAVKQELRAAV